MILHMIERAEPRDGFKVAVAFRDGREGTVDFAPVIADGGVYRALSDPERFRSVKIGDHGRSLVWVDAEGEEIDICADALWEQCISAKTAAA